MHPAGTPTGNGRMIAWESSVHKALGVGHDQAFMT